LNIKGIESSLWREKKLWPIWTSSWWKWKSRWQEKETPLNKDRNSEIDLIKQRSETSAAAAAAQNDLKVSAAQEEDLNCSFLATFSTNGIIYVNLYTIHLQSNCKPSGVFKTLLNNSKTWRNFRYANMFSTGFHPHMLQNSYIRTFCEDFQLHVRFWKSVIMIKCVCVQLNRNKATFKESSHSRAFWDFGQTKPKWLWGKRWEGGSVVLTGVAIGVSLSRSHSVTSV